MKSFLAVIMIFLCASAFGQQSVTSASLNGRVEDPSGGVIPGVQVSITSVDRNDTLMTTTDSEGRFRFPSLRVGTYEIRAELPGFATFTQRLTLTVGQAVELPIKLMLGQVIVQEYVSADAPRIEPARTQVAETIVPREIDALPLNGRNFLDLALLSPAVSKTNTGSNERFAETSAVPGTGISIAGQRNLSNGFVVDGLSGNDDAADLAGTFYTQEVIREFQVITSGGIAEFGRASSGVVNILTQNGTNEWRERLYGFLRNQRFDATNVFAAVDPLTGKRIRSAWTQGQYGASVGGPIRRNRTFVFSNFEQERLHRSGFISIAPANVTAINAVLDATGYSPPRVITGEYPTGDVRTSYFARTDLALTDMNHVALRYNLYDISSPNARNVGALSTISRGTSVADRDQAFAATHNLLLSPRSENELRFQFMRSRLRAPGNDLLGPAVNISGVANFGASTSSPTARDINLFELADSAGASRGNHYFKAGIDVLYNRVNIVFPASLFGSYTFSSLPNFLVGTYTTFTQAFGKTDWFQTNPNLGWFIQDEWKVRRDLTLNAGLRHDIAWLDAGIQTRTKHFSPRLGLAYAPGSKKTVLRAGFGQYYDRIPLRAVANALRGAGIEYKTVSLQRTQLGAPVFPKKLAAFPTGVLFNLATIDPQIKNAYSLQANLQVESELPGHIFASVGYLYARGTHIIMQRNLNVPTVAAQQDPLNLGRPNPNFANITQYSGQGDSYYNGMTMSVQHRASKFLMARMSYTLSKTIDNTGNAFFNSPQNNFNLRDDRGLSDNDQRHRVTFSGEVAARGFRLSPIFTYGSAYPFNIVTGGQTIQTTAARPAGVGRNTAVGFDYSSLDLRISRRFRIRDRADLEILGETFNTFNRANLQFPNNAFGTETTPLPAFGRPTAASDPRQIQFGLRLSL